MHAKNNPRLLCAFVLRVAVFLACGGFSRVACGQEIEQPTGQATTDREAHALLDRLAREGITQEAFEASTPVMQDFAAGNIDEEQARSRLVRIADGKLVKFLSSQLFRRFFRRADLSEVDSSPWRTRPRYNPPGRHPVGD